VDFEPMDDFERELKQALERRPAPPGLKRKLMEQRSRQRTERLRIRTVMWQRLAACLVLVSLLVGGLTWRNREERRKGEAARQQVLTALRITSHALNEMKAQLAEHDRNTQE
jgi:type VI protein secretion system component VasK